MSNNGIINIAEITKQEIIKPDDKKETLYNEPGTSIIIPTRKNNLRTKAAWNNYPSANGSDIFRVKMSGCQRSSSQEICDAIKLMEVTKALYGCSSVRLDVNDYVQGVEVTWTDENNHVISTNHEVFVSSTGRYCYKLQGEFGDDCCSREGCIFVLADDFEDKSIEIIPIIDPGCGSTGNKRGHVSLDVHNYPSGTTYSWSHNPNWNVHWTRVEPGQHSVTVTMPWGCKRSLDYTVENAENAVQVYDEIIPSDCGQNNGEIHIITNIYGEENTDLEVLWSNSSTGRSLYSLSPGQYCVTVTPVYTECPIIKCYSVPEKSIEIIPYITPNTECNGQAPNGRIELAIPNGIEPFSVTWADGSPDGLLRENLRVGSYLVTVTDANNCTARQMINVPGSETLAFSSEISQNCSTNLYTIRLFNFPNNYIYIVSLYKWINGVKEFQSYYPASNGYQIVGLNPGKYTLETTEFPCKIGTVEVDLPESFTFLNGQAVENMGCMSGEEDGEVTVYFEGGLRPLTVSLGNQSQTVQGNSVTFGNLNGGFHMINFVNPSGCINWLPTYIPYPIINIEGTVMHANGPNHNPPPSNGSIELQITGGSGQFEFEWIKNNVFYSSEKDIFNLMPGYYTVKVTDKLTGCEVTKSFQIEGVLCPSEDKIITYLYHSPTDECPVGANRDWANCEIGCNKKITLSLAINHWDGDLIFPFTVRVFHDNGYDISKEITGYPTLIEFSDLIPSFDPYTVTITNSCGYNIVKEIYACLPCSNIEPYEDGSFIRINDYKDFLIQIVKGCERETSWFGKKSKLIINSTTSPKSKLRLYSGQEYKISWPDSSQAVIKQIWSQGKQAHYIKGSGVYRLNESDFNGEVKTVKIERKDGCTRFYNFRIGYANDVIGIGTSDLNLDGTHATLNKTCQNCNLREFISTFNAYKYSNLCENISDYSKPLKLFHYIPNSANGSNPCIGGTLMRNLPSTNGVMIDAEEYVFPEYLLQNTSWQFRDDNEKEQEWSEGGSLSPVNNIDAGGCIFKKEYMFPQSNINHNLYVNWFRLRSWDYINQPSKQGCGEILNITRKGHIIEINVDPGDQGEKLIIRRNGIIVQEYDFPYNFYQIKFEFNSESYLDGV